MFFLSFASGIFKCRAKKAFILFHKASGDVGNSQNDGRVNPKSLKCYSFDLRRKRRIVFLTEVLRPR